MPEPACFLIYATANEDPSFIRDRWLFRRLPRRAPGVPDVRLVIAVAEARPRTAGDERRVARMTERLLARPGWRREAVVFRSNRGRDFGSYAELLDLIAGVARPDDWVLCLNRSVRGPEMAGWYAAFIAQHRRHPGVALCGSRIGLRALDGVARDDPPTTHVDSYALFGTHARLREFFAGLPALDATTTREAVLGGEYELSRRMLLAGHALTCVEWPDEAFSLAHLRPAAPPRVVRRIPFRHSKPWTRLLGRAGAWAARLGLL